MSQTQTLAKTLDEIDTQTHYKSMESERFSFLLQDKKQIIEAFKNEHIGVETGFKIGELNLEFPSGAITIIAGASSHGTTTALINFTLGALEVDPKKKIYFFTYKESTASVVGKLFLNSYIHRNLKKEGIDKPLAKNSRISIVNYFKKETDNDISEDMRPYFQKYKKSFFKDVMESGALRVHDVGLTAEKLVKAIHLVKELGSVDLVCIDSFDLLKTENTNLSTQDMQSEIVRMLKACAIETGMPIVLTSYFTTPIKSEADLDEMNIGEAPDIEWASSFTLGLYNRSLNKENPTNEICFKVLKSARTSSGHSSVMDFDGNKALILNKESD